MARYAHRIVSTGGAINDAMPAITSERKLVGFVAHVSAAPTTSEYLTVTLDSVAGAAHDVVIYKVDMSAASATDLVYTDANLPLLPGDALKVAFANSDARTIGITLILE